MTPEAQRIAIAEALGAKWSRLADHEQGSGKWLLGFTYKDREDGNHSLSAGTPWCVDFVVVHHPNDERERNISSDLPDYLNDLNVAISLCDIAREEGYDVTISRDDTGWCCVFSNDTRLRGSVRETLSEGISESFLRILNLWKD